MGVSPRPRTDRDLLAPASRHNRHVTGPDDLRGIAGWSRDDLYRAVRAAADVEDGCVVVDYGRERLYLARGTTLTYYPPRALGVAGPPALHVRDPLVFDPADGASTTAADVTVSPTFDILVPAFDWADLDEGELLPPVHRRPTATGTGSGTGAGSSG
jgi:hypothetical protein